MVRVGSLGDGGSDERDAKHFRSIPVQGGAKSLGDGADVAVTANTFKDGGSATKNSSIVYG